MERSNSSKTYYSFQKALDANYFRTPKEQEQTMLFSYYHRNDFPIPMHSHEFYEINIITEGTGKHYIESNSFPITSGDFCIIPPNIRHGYSEKSNLSIFHIILSDKFFTRYFDELRAVHGFSLLFNIEPKLRAKSNIKIFPSISAGDFIYFQSEITKLYKLEKNAGSMFKTEKCIKTLNLICEFAAIMTSDEYVSAAQSYIDIRPITSVLSYIDNNFDCKITLEGLCRLSNMSRSALLNKFQTLCNCTPAEYILSVRIDNAKKLLTDSDLSIASVAQDCGFYDSSHFAKAFYQKTGLLPKDFRGAR